MSNLDILLTETEIHKLRWRCRRGLLENDLLLAKFFNKFSGQLTKKHEIGLENLMNLEDNELFSLLLNKKSDKFDKLNLSLEAKDSLELIYKYI